MRQLRLTATGLAIVALVGCSIPSEDSPTRLDPAEVPFNLGEPTTTVAHGDDNPDQPISVFLVLDNRLTSVQRNAGPADAAEVLALLATGPTPAETEGGLRTALVPDLAQIVDSSGDLITINLDAEFSSLAPSEQRLALAQITFAMTQLSALNTVRFLVAGQPVSVPRGDGSSTEGPVGRSDYADLATPEQLS